MNDQCVVIYNIDFFFNQPTAHIHKQVRKGRNLRLQ